MELDLISINKDERFALWASTAEAIARGEGPSDRYDELTYRRDAMERFMGEMNEFLGRDPSIGEIATFSETGMDKAGGERKDIHMMVGRDTVLENEFAVLFASREDFVKKPVNIRIVADHEEAIRRKHQRVMETYKDVDDFYEGSDFWNARQALNLSAVATTERVQQETDHLADIEVHLDGDPKDWKVVIRSDSPQTSPYQASDKISEEDILRVAAQNGIEVGTKQIMLHISDSMKGTQTFRMYNEELLRDEGVEIVMIPYEMKPDQIEDLLDVIRKSTRIKGANVGAPFKTMVREIVVEKDDPMAWIGFDTIIEQEGRFNAFRFGGDGWVNAFKDEGYGDLKGKDVVILGAGATGTAIAVALINEGVKSITFTEEIEARKELVEKKFSETSKKIKTIMLAPDSPELNEAISKAHYVINATALGKEGAKEGLSPISDDVILRQDAILFDLNYHPAVTRFMEIAAAQGVQNINGAGLNAAMDALQSAAYIREIRGMDPNTDVLYVRAKDFMEKLEEEDKAKEDESQAAENRGDIAPDRTEQLRQLGVKIRADRENAYIDSGISQLRLTRIGDVLGVTLSSSDGEEMRLINEIFEKDKLGWEFTLDLYLEFLSLIADESRLGKETFIKILNQDLYGGLKLVKDLYGKSPQQEENSILYLGIIGESIGWDVWRKIALKDPRRFGEMFHFLFDVYYSSGLFPDQLKERLPTYMTRNDFRSLLSGSASERRKIIEKLFEKAEKKIQEGIDKSKMDSRDESSFELERYLLSALIVLFQDQRFFDVFESEMSFWFLHILGNAMVDTTGVLSGAANAKFWYFKDYILENDKIVMFLSYLHEMGHNILASVFPEKTMEKNVISEADKYAIGEMFAVFTKIVFAQQRGHALSDIKAHIEANLKEDFKAKEDGLEKDDSHIRARQFLIDLLTDIEKQQNEIPQKTPIDWMKAYLSIVEFSRSEAKKDSTKKLTFDIFANKVRGAVLSQTVGGIDLNPATLNLQTSGEMIDFHLPEEFPPLENIQIDGFTPVILEVVPATNLHFLLGIKKEDHAPQISHEASPFVMPRS